MVLNMEHIISATTTSLSSLSTLLAFVDYTAIVASQHIAGKSALIYLNHQVHCFLQLSF